MFYRSVVAVSLLAWGGLSRPAAAGDFQFKVPPGWRDSSPAEAKSTGSGPPAVASQPGTERVMALFEDLDPDGQKRAVIYIGSMPLMPVNQQSADLLAGQLVGRGGKIIDVEMTEVGDLRVAHATADAVTPQGELRLVGYLVPGPHELALLILVCRLSEFDHYSPIFARTLKDMKVAVAGPVGHTSTTFRGLVIIAIIVMLLIWYYRRKKYPH